MCRGRGGISCSLLNRLLDSQNVGVKGMCGGCKGRGGMCGGCICV